MIITKKNVNQQGKNNNADNLLADILFRVDSPDLSHYGFPCSFPYRENS